ncbi:MAG: hypothetical protein KAW09_05420, partial [Thermoplasmata archaeon]|nr:hypothetical protein [Thermoplasmata archaeon]
MIQTDRLRSPKLLAFLVMSLVLISSAFAVIIAAPPPESGVESPSTHLDGNQSGNDIYGSDGDGPSPTDTTVFPWPMHLHDERHVGFTQSPIPSSNSVLWWNSTGYPAFGSPAVAEGKVFVGARTVTGDYMFAFYQNNGTL